jgi:hypothetical protein
MNRLDSSLSLLQILVKHKDRVIAADSSPEAGRHSKVARSTITEQGGIAVISRIPVFLALLRS